MIISCHGPLIKAVSHLIARFIKVWRVHVAPWLSNYSCVVAGKLCGGGGVTGSPQQSQHRDNDWAPNTALITTHNAPLTRLCYSTSRVSSINRCFELQASKKNIFLSCFDSFLIANRPHSTQEQTAEWQNYLSVNSVSYKARQNFPTQPFCWI